MFRDILKIHPYTMLSIKDFF